MAAYVSLLLFGIAMALLSSIDRRNRRGYFIALAIVLALFSGLRYKVGTDYESYELLYDNVLNDWASSEVGYVALIHLMDKAGLGFFGVMFVVSLLTVAFAALALRRFRCGIHSLYLFMAIPLFFLLSLNTIRQSLAAAIFMLATRYARNADPRRFVAFVLLAATFHISAILLLPTYFIANRKPTFVILGVCLLVGVFFALNIPIAVELLGFHAVYLEEKEGSAVGQLVICLVAAVYFIFAARSSRKVQFTDEPLINYISVSAGICFASLFSTVGSGFILRMTTYFTWAIAVLVPDYIAHMRRGDRRRSALVAVYGVAAAYFLLTVWRGEAIDLVPYQTILTASGS